jgi:LmbE family N-acetylglucosaminyl deacetylase
MNILFLLAHQDDETVFASRIHFEVERGSVVHCVFFIDGSQAGTRLKSRDQESLAALISLGVSEGQIHFVGSQIKIKDGNLVRELDRAYACLVQLTSTVSFEKIFCLAWEGGHPDHDASHLLALAYSKEHQSGSLLLESSLYSAYQINKPFFRGFSLMPRKVSFEMRSLSFLEGLRAFCLIRFYPSQWKTWLGLSPFFFFQSVVFRREVFQNVLLGPRKRPHQGALLYERYFNISFEIFASITEPFRESHDL